MRGILTKLYNHTVVATMVTVFFCIAGAVAASRLVREGTPEISVDTVLIEITYLGADPYEVEEGIARKVEEAVDGLEGIKRYTTVSTQNHCRTAIDIKDGYPMEKALDNIRNAIDAISNFPTDAEKPIISEITIRNEVVFVALWGDLTERVAKETAEQIKDELQALPEVSQVSISGVRDYEIAFELSEEKMRQWGLTFDQVSQALRTGSVNLSGGTLRTKGEEIDIKASGRKYTGSEFAKIVVMAKPTGEIITLDQIAKIRDAFTEDEIIARFNGQPAAMIGVFKTDTEDAIKVAEATQAYVKKRAATLPSGVHLTAWNDVSENIERQIGILVGNGLQGLFLVVFTMWIFMGFRLSFWVAMGIPVAVSGALVYLYLTGGSLNTMTLLAMILVMGILVDDGIVISEAIFNRRWNGERGLAAAVHGIEEVGMPIIAAVLTTVVAFIPLFFIPSVIGKFVAIIPGVVIAAIMVDMFEASTCLPAHLSHLPDPHQPPKLPRWLRFLTVDFYIRRWITTGLFWFVDHVYVPFIYVTLRHRYAVVAAGIAFFIVTFVGVLGGGFVKFILFPSGDIPFIQAAVEFPQGTPINVTEAALRQTEEALATIEKEAESQGEKPFIKYVYSLVGQGSSSPFDQRAVGSFAGVVRVEMKSSDERTLSAQEVIARWQKATGNIPGAVVQSFGTLEQGPPGAPIQVWLKGNHIDNMLAASNEIKAKLRSYGGLYEIQDDFRAGNREIKVDLKPEARGLGITLDDLASQVHSGFFGEEAIRIQRGRDDIRVKVRYDEEERDTMADLDKVRIRTQSGQEVPFFSVANVHFGQSVASINRVDGQRRITVSAELVENRANAEEVLADLKSTFMSKIDSDYPDVHWSFEGVKKDTNDAFTALKYGFFVAMLAMYLIGATTFRSYLQPFIVMSSIPFGMTGAIYGHWAMGMPLSMFSVFGMVSLAGVAVNDSIVLVEAFNVKLSEGRSTFDALADAGARRFRSIFLTTFTTIIGTAPLIFDQDLAARAMIPMALSMSSGLIVACVATLVLLPALFAIANDVRRLWRFAFTGYWPTREEIEPGSKRRVDRYEEDIKDEPSSSEPVMVK